MNRAIAWLVALAAVLQVGATSAAAAAAPSACVFGGEPTLLSESGDPHGADGRRLERWEIPDRPVLWTTTRPAGAYSAFRAEVSGKAGETRPIPLLKQVPSRNNRLVIASARAWVRPINCLEMLLVGRQYARVPAFERPTEFAAIILRSSDGQRLRVYSLTVNQDGIGRPDPITQPALRDRLEGWTILAFLHNHGFHPGAPLTNGPIAPSIPDAGFNLNFANEAGPFEAWITNGLDTAHIPASTFPLFERPTGGG